MAGAAAGAATGAVGLAATFFTMAFFTAFLAAYGILRIANREKAYLLGGLSLLGNLGLSWCLLGNLDLLGGGLLGGNLLRARSK